MLPEVTSVTKSFIGAGSAARPGTDQSMVHPHERIERETTEAGETRASRRVVGSLADEQKAR